VEVLTHWLRAEIGVTGLHDVINDNSSLSHLVKAIALYDCGALVRSSLCLCDPAKNSEYVSDRSKAFYNVIVGDNRAISNFVWQKLGRDAEYDAPVLRQFDEAGDPGLVAD
jgi:hypothetical protein